ncbi:hypothetical protein BH09VER1_BH09VER1_18390 [soil metagenome]
MIPSTPPSLGARLYYDAFETARWAYNFPRRARFQQSLASLRTPPAGSPIAMNYGRVASTPASRGPVIGGQVKLIHLRERFPEQLEHFNLIYGVSSAIPYYLNDLVRASRRRGVRFVLNQNGVAYRSWCGDFFPWFNLPLRGLLRQADYVIYQSEFCRTYADRYLTTTDSPHCVLFNPVDIRQFSPPPRPPDFARWEILAAGTNHHFYRVQAALDCLAELMAAGLPARLTFAGDFVWAGGKAQVDAYVASRTLEDHVRFLPPFSQAEAPAIYRGAHLLVHPKYKDPCPTVPLEALACGVPVVGSRSGGMPELITPDVGELVPVPDDDDRDHGPDPSALAGSVKRIMASHHAFSTAARARAEQVFSHDAWLDAHEEIFRKLLA